MKKLSLFLICVLSAVCLNAQENLSKRAYKDMDATAFCSYDSYHPSQYITDNNWEILLALRNPSSLSVLDSLGIKYTNSQILLLDIGGLIKKEKGRWKTSMPIFDKQQTDSIRRISMTIARNLYAAIADDCRLFVKALSDKGFQANAYTLMFSYVLDGKIWDRIVKPSHLAEHATWSGAYWAMYDARKTGKIGTNGYGKLYINWSDKLLYYPDDSMIFDLVTEYEKNGKVTDKALISELQEWGLVNKEGIPVIPILRKDASDSIDIYSDRIVNKLSEGIKDYIPRFMEQFAIADEKSATVILYHELMWDLLAVLESDQVIFHPDILGGKEVGKENLKNIAFFVVE